MININADSYAKNCLHTIKVIEKGNKSKVNLMGKNA